MISNLIKLIVVITFICISSNLTAGTVQKNGVKIMHPHIPLVAPKSTSASGYLSVQNKNGFQLLLKQIKTDFSNSMLHRTVTNDSGIVKMIHLNEIKIEAYSSLIFEPGGYHIMFTKINKQLVEGDIIPTTLIFNENIEIDVNFRVESIKSGSKEHSKHNH